MGSVHERSAAIGEAMSFAVALWHPELSDRPWSTVREPSDVRRGLLCYDQIGAVAGQGEADLRRWLPW